MAAERVETRLMQETDLDFAAGCTRSESWASETRPAFEDFLAHDSEGCFLVEVGGAPSGICVATSYGRMGFIGELIVLPAVRGLGLGGRLLERAITCAKTISVY
ncbi:MAG: GNAT family N-acetyltransferase [Anaerolineales bacterium]|nr:GNAT family N-acetyltransferase [Anaerolineales bacterium]